MSLRDAQSEKSKIEDSTPADKVKSPILEIFFENLNILVRKMRATR